MAKAFHDGVQVGFLWSRVMWWWTVGGPFWARRRVQPRERMEWFLEFHEPPGSGRLPFEDGFYDVAEMLDDFRRGEVSMNGRTYTLHWLHGADAEAVTPPDDYWDKERR